MREFKEQTRLFQDLPHYNTPINVTIPLNKSRSIVLSFYRKDYNPANLCSRSTIGLTSIENHIDSVYQVDKELDRVRQNKVGFEDIQDKVSFIRRGLNFKRYVIDHYLKREALKWWYVRKL